TIITPPPYAWAAGRRAAPDFVLWGGERPAGVPRGLPRATGDRDLRRPSVPEPLPARGPPPQPGGQRVAARQAARDHRGQCRRLRGRARRSARGRPPVAARSRVVLGRRHTSS